MALKLIRWSAVVVLVVIIACSTPSETLSCSGMPPEVAVDLDWGLNHVRCNSWRVESWSKKGYNRHYNLLYGKNPAADDHVDNGCVVNTMRRVDNVFNWRVYRPDGFLNNINCTYVGNMGGDFDCVTTQATGYNQAIDSNLQNFTHVIIKTDNSSYVLFADCWEDGDWTWGLGVAFGKSLSDCSRKDINEFLLSKGKNQYSFEAYNLRFDQCPNNSCDCPA